MWTKFKTAELFCSNLFMVLGSILGCLVNQRTHDVNVCTPFSANLFSILAL